MDADQEDVATGVSRTSGPARSPTAGADHAAAAAEARECVERARLVAHAMIAGAEAERQRILADLDRCRRVATAEIERLQAARDRLLGSYAVVRRTLDEIDQELAAVSPSATSAPAPAPPPVGGVGAAEEGDTGAGRSDADELALQQRDADLDGLAAGMVRRLKRVLQDEHNDLLDRLRKVRGTPVPAEILEPPAAQAARYAGATRPFAAQAAAAGARFALSRTPAPAGPRSVVVADRAATAVAVRAVADVVADVVEPLRRRVEAVLDEWGRDGPDVLVDALASVYREARSQRIESLTSDVLSSAHADATWRAAPEGSALRWICEDADGPCPDCDDNMLAGTVVKGEAFPTGQLYPPAHRGCRCLLLPEGG